MKRTSPQVHVKDEERVMTHPEIFFSALVAIEVRAIALVLAALLWDAPLEGLADPMHPPNPAKASRYQRGTANAPANACEWVQIASKAVPFLEAAIRDQRDVAPRIRVRRTRHHAWEVAVEPLAVTDLLGKAT